MRCYRTDRSEFLVEPVTADFPACAVRQGQKASAAADINRAMPPGYIPMYTHTRSWCHHANSFRPPCILRLSVTNNTMTIQLLSTSSTTDGGHSIECKLTPATRSPLTEIRFCTLCPVTLILDLFDLILNGRDSWWTIFLASLVIVVSAVLVLSYVRTDRQTDRHTDVHTDRRRWTLYSRDSRRCEYIVILNFKRRIPICSTEICKPFNRLRPLIKVQWFVIAGNIGSFIRYAIYG